MKSVVKIIYKDTKETLFECDLNKIGQAYQRFSEYEDMGLDVELIVPSTPQTLINQLHLTDEEKREFEKSLQEEIDEHDESCCYKLASDTSKIIQ